MNLDENEAIRQYQTYGLLNAVRYVQSETGFGLKECKNYLDKIIAQSRITDFNKGSITWFKCTDKLPPTTNKTALANYSDHVLISDGISIDKKEFVRTINETPIGWMGSNIIGFVPTHWAFINLPEPVQD